MSISGQPSDSAPFTPEHLHVTDIIDLGLSLLVLGAETPRQKADVRSGRVPIAVGRTLSTLIKTEQQYPNGMRLKDIVTHTCLPVSTVSEAVTQLERGGLLTRERLEHDHRAYSIRLTDLGRESVKGNELCGIWSAAAEGLPREDIEAFWRVIEHAAQKLHEIAAERQVKQAIKGRPRIEKAL